MLRTGEKRKIRGVKNQQKSHLFLSERSKLYEFSQSNRILLVIPSSQSVNEESSTVRRRCFSYGRRLPSRGPDGPAGGPRLVFGPSISRTTTTFFHTPSRWLTNGIDEDDDNDDGGHSNSGRHRQQSTKSGDGNGGDGAFSDFV